MSVILFIVVCFFYHASLNDNLNLWEEHWDCMD